MIVSRRLRQRILTGLVFAGSIAVTSTVLAQVGGGACPLGAAELGKEVERTFTSSTGRTLRFRFMLPGGSDSSAKQGVAMYFHGNVPGTDKSYVPELSLISKEAAAHGLVPVAGLSPETTVVSNEVVRCWMPTDQALIRELLASDFGGCIPLDRSKVFLVGGSQGTCFIAGSLMTWLWRDYRGGIYGGCGCWSVDNVDTNVERLRDTFKVFVETTTEDFLYPDGRLAHDVFKYNLKAPTRGDIDRAGGHCDGFNLSLGKALDWMVENADYPDNARKDGYWEHVDVRMNQYAAVAANPSGRFAVATTRDDLPDEDRWLTLQMQSELASAEYVSWKAQHYPKLTQVTTLRVTDDYGESWREISDVPGEINALVLTDAGALFASGPDGLYQAESNTTTLAPVAFAGDSVIALKRTESGRLLAYTSKRGLVASDDDGRSWQDLGIPYEVDTTGSLPFFLSYQSGVLLVQRPGPVTCHSEDGGKSWTTTNLPKALASGRYAFAHAGRAFYAAALGGSELQVSQDAGQTWTAHAGPPFAVTELGTTPDGDVLACTSKRLCYRSADGAQTWNVETGYYLLSTLRAFGTMNLAYGPNGKAMVANARGILRLHTPETVVVGSGGAAGKSGDASASGGSPSSGTSGGAGGTTGTNATKHTGSNGGCGCALANTTKAPRLFWVLTALLLLRLRGRQRCPLPQANAPDLAEASGHPATRQTFLAMRHACVESANDVDPSRGYAVGCRRLRGCTRASLRWKVQAADRWYGWQPRDFGQRSWRRECRPRRPR